MFLSGVKIIFALQDLSPYSRKPEVAAESKFIFPRNSLTTWLAAEFPTWDCPCPCFISSHPSTCKTPTPHLWTSLQCWYLIRHILCQQRKQYIFPSQWLILYFLPTSTSTPIRFQSACQCTPSPTPQAPSIRTAPSIPPPGISSLQRCQRPLYHFYCPPGSAPDTFICVRQACGPQIGWSSEILRYNKIVYIFIVYILRFIFNQNQIYKNESINHFPKNDSKNKGKGGLSKVVQKFI